MIVRPQPVLAALLNLTGLGVGYLYLRRARRWFIHLLITAGLLAGVYFALPLRPWNQVSLGALGLWLLWMVIDGARQARKTWERANGSRFLESRVIQPVFNRLWAQSGGRWARLLPYLIALVLLAGEAAGFYYYRLRAGETIQAAQSAYARADFPQAIALGTRATTLYRLAFHPDFSNQLSRIGESQRVLTARAALTGSQPDYAGAVDIYEGYLSSYPQSPHVERIETELLSTYQSWASEQRARGEYESALATYQTLATRHEKPEISELVQRASAALRFEWGGSLRGASQHEAALAQYELILKENAAALGGTAPLTATRLPSSSWVTALTRSQVQTAAAETLSAWANALSQAGQFEEAVDKITRLREDYPSTLAGLTSNSLLSDTYTRWAVSLRRAHQYPQALEKYRFLAESALAPEVQARLEANLAETYLEWAGYLSAEREYTQAVQTYFALQQQYPQSESAAQAAPALEQLYQTAADMLKNPNPTLLTACDLMEIFTAFTAVNYPGEPFQTLARKSDANLPEALYQCGQSHYQAGEYGQAIEVYTRLVEKYPLSKFATLAQAGLVDARVAEIKKGQTGQLPQPPESGAAAAGTALLEISNDAPERLEFLLSGPGSQSFTLDKCETCQKYNIVGPLYCPEKGPKKYISLKPGHYEVIVRAVDNDGVSPWYGSWELESGKRYFNCFYILTTVQ